MMLRRIVIIIICMALLTPIISAKTVLTVDKVRELAMDHNRQLQSARKELDRARGEIISARSGALPQISLDGKYTRNIEIPELFFNGQAIPIGQNNDFSLALSLTQPIYNGGKAYTAWKIAKIYEKYNIEKVNEVERNIVYNAESMFYSAILAQSYLDVVKNSYEQLSHNYDVVEKFYNQGMVSEYELLRAKVEKLNLEPKLVAAESQVKLSRKQLKSFLGIALDDEVELVSELGDTTVPELPQIDSLVNLALEVRPELKQAVLQVEGYDKAVGIAKSDWLRPSLNFNTTYSFSGSSDDFRLAGNETSNSWTASLILSIPLFDGGRTIGEVRKAKTDYYQAVLSKQQLLDDIRLEVEQSYDKLIQAQKTLWSQEETIQQAEEGMRIANLRYETGVGTQLEILSAQTALTDARTNMAKAIYDLRLAKSELKKTSGYEIK